MHNEQCGEIQPTEDDCRKCYETDDLPEVLFDGYSVLDELTDAQKNFVSPEAVSAVLNAAVRLIKKRRGQS